VRAAPKDSIVLFIGRNGSPSGRMRRIRQSRSAIIFFLAAWTALATTPAPSPTISEADQARASIKRIAKLLPSATDPAELMYMTAARYAALGEKPEALAWLRKVSELHEGFDPSGDDELKSLSGEPEFQRLVGEIHRALPPKHRSEVAFSIPEKDLIPEGIAYDPKEKAFYLGSLYKRKIVKVTSDGHASDFKRPREDGLWEVLGMKVDPHGGLWANSAAEFEDPAVTGSSAVFHFDLASGKLIKKYEVDGKKQPHLFNDLVLNAQGDVFVTDSKAGKIYWIPHERDALEEFAPGLEFIYPNGIALSANEKILYVAHAVGGISLIDLSTKRARILPRPTHSTLAGVDGLYLYKNSLVAIQNGIGTPRVSHFFLNAAGDRVEKVESIEYRNSDFDVPTTGTFAADVFYYIANSQLEKLDDKGEIKPDVGLRPVLIMRSPL
jgi:SMP-30/Gluconolactonase/LRE-like region